MQTKFIELYNEVGEGFAVAWAKQYAIKAAQIQLWIIQLTKGI